MALFFIRLYNRNKHIMIEKERIELLILRELNSEITPAEQTLLMKWIDSSEKNNTFYKQQVELFKVQGQIFTNALVSQSREKAKTGIINRLLQKNRKVKSFVYSSLSIFTLAIALTTFFFQSNLNQRNELLAGAFTIEAPAGHAAHFVLPDGTEVWLNASSKLTFKYDTDNTQRVAGLNGEGYFKVASDKNHPFIVEGYSHDVKVYGTEFNMVSRKKSKEYEVTLKEGSVGIIDNSNREVARLKPGQQFLLDSNGGGTIKMVESINAVSGWVEGRYEFKDATLEEIADALAAMYDVVISIEDEELKQKRYRCVLKKERSVLKTLQIFSITTNLDYTIQGHNISLKQKK